MTRCKAGWWFVSDEVESWGGGLLVTRWWFVSDEVVVC